MNQRFCFFFSNEKHFILIIYFLETRIGKSFQTLYTKCWMAHSRVSDNFWQLKALMKNAFYFMPKALFVLKIFKFLSWLFGYVEKRLDKKAKANFRIYGVTDWISISTMHILPNVSNTRNIFLQKSFRKWGRVCNRNKLHHISGCWPRDMLSFDIF